MASQTLLVSAVDDISGVIINGSGPIAVISGTRRTAPSGVADKQVGQWIEMLPDTNNGGKNFVIPPLSGANTTTARIIGKVWSQFFNSDLKCVYLNL